MILSAVNEYWTSAVARYRASPLPAFFRWWGGELAQVFPESLRKRMMPPRPTVLLAANLETADLEVWIGGDDPKHQDTFGKDEDAHILRDRWQELLNSFTDGAPEVRLCLPAEEVLQRPVELPLAVESNLDTAVSYQLDQLTPFSTSQVYHDFRLVRRDAQHNRLELDLRLVPLNRIEGIRERLAAIGIRPHAIDTLTSDEELLRCEGFNLLPETERPPYVYARARLNWVLAGTAALILLAVMFQSLHLRGQERDRLQEEVAQLRLEAEQVIELQNQLEDALVAANFLAERRRRQPVIIQVLDEVSRILPQDMWLNQMQVRGDELQMMGLADASERLIEIVNESPLLDDAEFRGAINVDPNTGQERFNARATINRRGVQDAAAAGPGE
jgi:general secretion pathway protein L